MASRICLRLLIVEDSEDDAELLLRELKSGFGVVESLRVDTPEGMRSALLSRTWDLIVADFNMPHFSAPAAIELLQTMELDIPLIIVSGSVGEEIAVRSMRAGAQDFLLKGSFQRLVPAIERELVQAEQRRARRQADERSRFLAAIVESSADSIISTDLTGLVVSWNRGAELMYGRRPDEMIGRPISDLEPDERRGEVAGLLESITRGEHLRRYETERLRRDGTRLQVAVSLFPIRDGQGKVVGAASVARDVSDKYSAEQALRASEERYRLLFDNNPQPMWVFDEETLRFLAVNHAACLHYGYTREEFLKMTIRDIRPPEEIPQLERLIGTESKRLHGAGTWRHRRKDGKIIDVEISAHSFVFDGRPAQFVFPKDVTQERSLEMQLRQAQKMEAVGRLAGGVAHDFNNVLTAILGYADLLATAVREDATSAEYVREIGAAGERAATLTRQLLAFSRQQLLEPTVLDINSLVGNLQKMMGRLLGEHIEFVTMLAPRVGHVRADAGQLEQVVMNLAINARDALPRGGTLTIETSNVEIGPADEAKLLTPPGSYVMIAVTDTGTGMTSETKAHIFEPFFTTKEKGKGTGLGLATVYGIVKQSGGYIWVYSEIDRGTTFKVYLPRVEAPVDDTLSRPPRRAVIGGNETILLVEDESTVRTLARKILVRLGYTVLEAESGPRALEILRTSETPIALMLTDVVMPELTGSELVARVLMESPGTKTILMSGYTDDAIVRQGLIDKAQHFLQKPFAPDTLARKVREVLDDGQRDSSERKGA